VSRREDPAPPAIVSARRALGQLILCQGCCCGRTDRGFPEVPVERIKAAWKAGRLNRTIQLTISGCVGPCDVANVAVIVRPEGTSWFGGLDDRDHYDALVRWAESCHASGEALPTPAELARHRFDYLVPTAHACNGEGRVPVAAGAGRDRPESAGEDRDG
jgi:cobaltochelatase CobN